jgi:N-methylhydantoinase A
MNDMLQDKGFEGSFQLTRSGGGVLPEEEASDRPIHTVLSGPAGGLIGASYRGNEMDREDLIAIDMGGTSVDACVIQGSANVTYETELETFPLLIPTYDIRTLGAGGGSIAWLDGDLLKVGPQSAGADPGPVCYDRGGTEPTVTDAAIELGYIDPEEFLGGDMSINSQKASQALQEKIAEPLDQTTLEVSRGIIDVLIGNISNAIHEITVEKGLDPRDFSLMSYGGAGPMLMPLLAREMDIQETIVPQAPAVFSAWGMLQADATFDFSQTITKLAENVEIGSINTIFQDLDDHAIETLEENGISENRIRLDHTVDMRYFGQGSEVEVDAEGAQTIDELVSRFNETHKQRYGHMMDDPSQIVNVRVRAVGEYEKPGIQEPQQIEGDAHVGTNEAYCFAENDLIEFDVYNRQGLSESEQVAGPAIIREPNSTAVLYSDQRATIDEFGNIVIT